MTEWRILVLLTLLLAGVVIGAHAGTLYIDTRPDTYLRPGRLLGETVSAWARGTGLGAPNYDTGYLPTAAIVWFLQALGMPPWLSMRVWRLLLYVVAGLGVRQLFLDLHLGARRMPTAAARVILVVVYVLNPYVLSGAASTPIMLPYASLPWLLLALRRSFRDPWWAGPSAVGLVFFLMGGFNAGVVPLIMLTATPLVVADVWWRDKVRPRVLLRGLAVSAGAGLMVSLYWVAATVSAFGTASAVAESTEDPRVVAQVSSFAEVLRGQGTWLQYGADALGPYDVDYRAFITMWLVIIASFLVPVLAFWGAAESRSRVRGLAVGLMLLGAVLMVGAYPPAHPSLFGRGLLFAFDHIPATLAFRTTTKAGPIAFLGMALLVGLGMASLWPRINEVSRGWVAGVLAVVTLVSVSPAAFGALLTGKFGVPDYWTTAFDDLDTREADGRLWMLPGETNSIYRWRPRGVDEYAPSLLDRGVVYRRSFPAGPGASVDALAGADEQIETSSAPRSLISTYARYLGVNEVLVRNDMLWEFIGAARPLAIVTQAEADPGLRISSLIGAAGTNMSPSELTQDKRPDEAKLAPLIRYRVTNPGAPVRAMPVGAEVLVSGNNAGVSGAIWSRRLDGDQPFRLLPQMSDSEVAQALRAGDPVVVTDTNRRRASNDHKLNQSGSLLSLQSTDPRIRTLGGNADETVMRYAGISNVQASSSGSIFGPTPTGRPFLALDDNPRTAWQFGDFNSAGGAWLKVSFVSPRIVGRVRLDRSRSDARKISELTVEAGGVVRRVRFGNQDSTFAQFPPSLRAASLKVTVDATVGKGVSQVGLVRLGVRGLRAREQPTLPTRLHDLALKSQAVRRALSTNRLDVVLTKSDLEQESRLRRFFTTEADRLFDMRARVAVPGSARTWRRCKTIGTLDGEDVQARFVGRLPQRTYDASGRRLPVQLELRGCGSRIALSAGSHDFESAALVLLNGVRFGSRATVPDAAADPATNVSWSRGATTFDATVAPARRDQYLFVAESYDPRWRATIDGGRPVKPVLLNGYGLGFRIPAGGAHKVHIAFTPQSAYLKALVVSLTAVALCLIGVVLGLVRRRRGDGVT